MWLADKDYISICMPIRYSEAMQDIESDPFKRNSFFYSPFVFGIIFQLIDVIDRKFDHFRRNVICYICSLYTVWI